MKNKVFKLSLISTLGLAIVLGCSKNSWFNSKEESNVEVRELSDNTENVSAYLADGGYGVDLGFSPKTHMVGGTVGGGGSVIGDIIGGAALGLLVGAGAGAIGAGVGSGSSTRDGTLYYNGTGTWVGSSTGSQTTPTTSPGETGTGTPIAQPVEGTLPQPTFEKFTSTFQPVELPGDKFIPYDAALTEVKPKDEWITGVTTYDGTLGGSTYNGGYSWPENPYSDEELERLLKELGKTMADLEKCLLELFGIGTLADFFYKKSQEKGTMYLGRFVDDLNDEGFDFNDYSSVASSKDNGYCFHGTSKSFATYGALAVLANWSALNYAIMANWDFVLCTDPYYYITEHYEMFRYAPTLDGEVRFVGGESYMHELLTLRITGYNAIRYNTELGKRANPFTWQDLKRINPINCFEAYFEPSNYLVRRA